MAVKGGDKFAAALEAIAKRITADKVKVGFLQGATYPTGQSVPMIAAINEYGRPPVQPPRPFFRIMIRQYSPAWPTQIGKLLIVNNYDTHVTLEQMGQLVKSQLQMSIQQLVSPALAPSTIARKGHSKPLIDTGHMLNSVDYVVS